MQQVAKIILHKDKKVLLELRDNLPSIRNPNQWSLFGGIVESGESAQQCVVREVKEELDIYVTHVELVKKEKVIVDRDYLEKNIYKARLSEVMISQITLREGQDMQFFGIEDINYIDISPHLKKDIYNFLRNNG